MDVQRRTPCSMLTTMWAVSTYVLISRIDATNKKTIREFVCGWGAAFINVIITFPLNKVMFRQMLHGVKSQAALDQIKNEGIGFVYRGILPPLIQKTYSVSVMFGTFEKSTQFLKESIPQMSPATCLALSGFVAGTFESLLTPLERIQTLLQDNKYHVRYRNTLHAALSLRKYGAKEYFRGLSPILIRNGPSNVLFFGMKTKIQDMDILPETENLVGHFIEDFISGAVIGAMISTVFYPVNVVKTRMQVQVSGRFPSFLEVFWLIYEERQGSIRKLFYGIHLNYIRAIITWGIINATYELLKKLIPIEESDEGLKSEI